MYKLPLNTGNDMDIPDDWTETWGRFYSHEFVGREVPKAIMWCIDNPTKQKTKRGSRRFLGSWLSRAWERDGGGHTMKELS